jgi:hypothetical protein
LSLAKEDGESGARRHDWLANGLEERMKVSSSLICSLGSSVIIRNGFKPSGLAGIVVDIISSNEPTRMTIPLFQPGPSLFPTTNSWLVV